VITAMLVVKSTVLLVNLPLKKLKTSMKMKLPTPNHGQLTTDKLF
jgi:hypothetical protein